MTIDINLLRAEKGGQPDLVRQSQERRFRDPSVVDKVIELDQNWIKKQYETEQTKKKVNEVKKAIGERKKKDKTDPCEDLAKERAAIEAEIAKLGEEADALLEERNTQLASIGNIIDDTVPISKDEDADNEVVATWGVPRDFGNTKYQTTGFRPHFELIEMIGGINFEAGRDVFGSRGYFLTGPAVLLNQAMINYGLGFLMRDGYTPVQPPFMMKKDVMGQAAELKDYDEVLYKVTNHDGDGQEVEEETKYLIATSEQPITALYRNQVIDRPSLPIRFAGTSTCFRKEAGSHGRDIRGIFRCHQFEKVEQFCIVEPDLSKEEHEKIINQAKAFYQSLGVPYRVVNIVSGEINDAASKKYDLEGWFPGDDDGKGKYRELVSASNCLDFQSRRMNTRAGHNTDQVVPHMLNSTLCATQRAMCCLLENYQEADGIRVPRVLVPYMAGMEFIPFVKAPPKPDPAPKAKK